MRRVLLTILIGGLLLSLVFLPSAAHATVIQFQATDLIDTSPGQDLWRYTYVVSGFSFPQNVAFETLFDPALYSNLQDPPPVVNADWDIISLQPDPALPDVGRYSALVLVDGASLADPFPLSFVWLGGPGTTPGAQPFEINEFDAQGNFIGTLETGQTTPAAQAVPLPFPTANDLAGPAFVQPFAGLAIVSESGGIAQTEPFFSDLPDGAFASLGNRVVNILGNFQAFDPSLNPLPFTLDNIVGVEVMDLGITFTPAFGAFDFAGHPSLTFTDALNPGNTVTFLASDSALAFTFLSDMALEYSYTLLLTGLPVGSLLIFDDAEVSANDADSDGELTSLDPSILWVGLKNSDDQGTQFDLRAKVYINDTLVSDGITRCITGVTRNPNKAKEVAVPFGSISDGAFESGDELSVKISTRIGTKPDDTKCPGHANAVGLRLYYDAISRPSRFGAELTPDPLQDFFLHSDGTDFLDDTAPTATTAQFKDSSSVNFAGGNPWKVIGTWSMTLP